MKNKPHDRVRTYLHLFVDLMFNTLRSDERLSPTVKTNLDAVNALICYAQSFVRIIQDDLCVMSLSCAIRELQHAPALSDSKLAQITSELQKADPPLNRTERAAMRDYIASFRADYPHASRTRLREVMRESRRILLDAREPRAKKARR